MNERCVGTTETTTPDPETGKTVVTNLRLPGQYDERLLGALGLQGPYYNWNRWYLPSVGRYLELDPIAKAKAPTERRPASQQASRAMPASLTWPGGRGQGLPPVEKDDDPELASRNPAFGRGWALDVGSAVELR